MAGRVTFCVLHKDSLACQNRFFFPWPFLNIRSLAMWMKSLVIRHYMCMFFY